MIPSRPVLIADSSPLFRQGLRTLLNQQQPLRMILETDNLDRLRAMAFHRGRSSRIAAQTPGMIIVDRSLPGLSAFEQLTDLPGPARPPLLIMAECTEPAFLSQAHHRGIKGVISKSATPAQFIEAISEVAQGRSWYWRPPQATPPVEGPVYSPEQQQVVSLLKKGLRNKQIAYELQLSEQSVKSHILQIYRKLGIPRNRILLVKTV